MSRGLGKLQRALLDVMPDRPCDTFELTALAFGLDAPAGGVVVISPSQRAAAARALASLQKAGLAEKLFTGRHGRSYWGRAAYAARYRQRLGDVFPTQT